MTDANQGFALDEAIRRAGPPRRARSRLDRGAAAGRRSRRPRPPRRASTSTPIAVGESLYSIRHFREYMAKGACIIVQVDVARIGGITPWLKVAHAAEAFDMPVCPHFLMELHVSLACAVPNGRYVEYIPQLDDLTTSRLAIEDGMAVAPIDAGHRRRLGFRRGEGEAASPNSHADHREGGAHEAHGHGDRRQAGAHRRIQAPATPPCGRRSSPRSPTATSGTIRSSCASRRTCCSAIGNITATTGRPTRRRWRPTRSTQEWWAIHMPMQAPLATREDGEWWAMAEEVFHLD